MVLDDIIVNIAFEAVAPFALGQFGLALDDEPQLDAVAEIGAVDVKCAAEELLHISREIGADASFVFFRDCGDIIVGKSGQIGSQVGIDYAVDGVLQRHCRFIGDSRDIRAGTKRKEEQQGQQGR